MKNKKTFKTDFSSKIFSFCDKFYFRWILMNWLLVIICSILSTLAPKKCHILKITLLSYSTLRGFIQPILFSYFIKIIQAFTKMLLFTILYSLAVFSLILYKMWILIFIHNLIIETKYQLGQIFLPVQVEYIRPVNPKHYSF